MTLFNIFYCQSKCNYIDGAGDALIDFAIKAILWGHKFELIVAAIGEYYRQTEEVCIRKYNQAILLLLNSKGDYEINPLFLQIGDSKITLTNTGIFEGHDLDLIGMPGHRVLLMNATLAESLDFIKHNFTLPIQ